MTTSAAWKVGRLARAGGPTVRTPHHWDTIGLLSPSRRTPGAPREYTEDDLVRPYRVPALRGLGPALDTIAVCLDAGVDPLRPVRDHLAGVEASVAALGALLDRLVRLDGERSADRAPAAADLLEALRAVGGTGPEAEHALGRHVDAGGREVLRTRAAAPGPAAHCLLGVEWPELYRGAGRLRAAKTPATDGKVRRLVARTDELSALSTGGDAGIRAGVRAARHDGPAALSNDPGAPGDDWREPAEYLDRARRGRV